MLTPEGTVGGSGEIRAADAIGQASGRSGTGQGGGGRAGNVMDPGSHGGTTPSRTPWIRDLTASERIGSGVSWRSRWRGLGGLAGGYLLADYGGDAVAAHGDAVEGVGGLHRAALVGDDDELGTLPELLEDQEQPLQVRVVQGRFHLVEHVERRGAGDRKS